MRRRDFLRTLMTAGAAIALGTLPTQIEGRGWAMRWGDGVPAIPPGQSYIIGVDHGSAQAIAAVMGVGPDSSTIVMFINQEGQYARIGTLTTDEII